MGCRGSCTQLNSATGIQAMSTGKRSKKKRQAGLRVVIGTGSAVVFNAFTKSSAAQNPAAHGQSTFQSSVGRSLTQSFRLTCKGKWLGFSTSCGTRSQQISSNHPQSWASSSRQEVGTPP